MTAEDQIRTSYESAVEDLLKEASDSEGRVLREIADQMNRGYRPTRGEVVLYTGLATFSKFKTKTLTRGIHGFSGRIRVAKGLRYRFGNISFAPIRYESLERQGTGSIYITNKRIRFDAGGTGADWSRTWGSIASWEVFQDGFLVRLQNGKPVVFNTSTSRRPIDDPRVIALALELAYES